MKKLVFLLFAVMVLVQGCTRESRSDVDELGHDMKRDVNKAARNIDDKVKDAVD